MLLHRIKVNLNLNKVSKLFSKIRIILIRIKTVKMPRTCFRITYKHKLNSLPRRLNKTYLIKAVVLTEIQTLHPFQVQVLLRVNYLHSPRQQVIPFKQ